MNKLRCALTTLSASLLLAVPAFAEQAEQAASSRLLSVGKGVVYFLLVMAVIFVCLPLTRKIAEYLDKRKKDDNR